MPLPLRSPSANLGDGLEMVDPLLALRPVHLRPRLLGGFAGPSGEAVVEVGEVFGQRRRLDLLAVYGRFRLVVGVVLADVVLETAGQLPAIDGADDLFEGGEVHGYIPVDPNPPAPRSLSESEST